MSDTQHKRFEIDLEEIERQLRRSVGMPPSPAPADPKADHFAELARIVGQQDPFAGILGPGRGSAPPDPEPATTTSPPSPAEPVRAEPVLSRPSMLTGEERDVMGASSDEVHAERTPAPYFDPVADVYGSADNAVDSDEFQPLAAPRSRRRLAAVAGLLVVAVGAGAGVIAWRNGSASFRTSGPPPLIKADNAPLKVAPENPGGMEIPNQNRQIYERGSKEGASRVLDRQEQPIDVREATRSMPVPDAPQAGTVVPPPATNSASAPIGPASPTQPTVVATVQQSSPSAPSPDSARGPTRTSVTSALGEPRRVRTVAVRPDGSIFPSAGSAAADPVMTMLPGGPPPPPVSVATVAVPANPAPLAATPASGTPPAGATPVSVLPPQRPRIASASQAIPPSVATTDAASEPFFRGAEPGRTDASDAVVRSGESETLDQGSAVRVQPPARPSRGTRTASTTAGTNADGADTAAAATSGGARGFSVQLAVRPTEDEARAAYSQLSDKYATDLGGKPATIARAEVSGKTVFRVRIGPLSRAEASTLCTRLKSSGGACFVAAN